MDLTPPHKVRRYRGRLVLRRAGYTREPSGYAWRRPGPEPSASQLRAHATALFAPALPRTQIMAAADAAERLLAGVPESRTMCPDEALVHRGHAPGTLDSAFMREIAEEFIAEHPEARAPEVLEHVRSIGSIPIQETSFSQMCSRIRAELGISVRPGTPAEYLARRREG